MKKFLLSMMAVFAMGYAAAETYTINIKEALGNEKIDPLTYQWVSGGFRFQADKAQGGTAPAYFNNGYDMRLYANNTMKVEANGANITSMVFTISTRGLQQWADVTATSGTIVANVEGKTATWTGSAKDFTLTVGADNTHGTQTTKKAGQFDFTDITITTDGPVADFDPVVTPVEASAEYKLATSFAAGKYAIVYADTVASALTTPYGYLPGEKVEIANDAFTAPLATTFTFTEVAGKGYTIQDRNGKYYYMKGTYNSFNVADELPEAGAYFTVSLAADGKVTIVNTEMQKTVMFGIGYHSFGAYPEANDTRALPSLYAWVKDNEGSEPQPEVTSVTALSQLASLKKNDNITMDVDLTVVYANGSYLYVYDGTNYGLVYKSGLGLEAGQVIAKGWAATIDIYNNLIEVKPTEATLATSGVGVVPAPAVVEADEVSTMLTVANQNVYVQINDVVFAEATPAADATKGEDGVDHRNFTGTADGTEIAFYQRFGIESVPAGTYAVKGFISVFKENIQVFPIAFVDMTSIDTIEAANAPATYYTIQGVKVANPVAGQLYIRVQNGKAEKVVK